MQQLALKLLIVVCCLFGSNVFAEQSYTEQNDATHLSAQNYPLSYYTEIYPPSSFYNNNQLTGISVELMRAMWRDMNMPQQKIIVVPWARGYRQISMHPNNVLFAMSRTAERDPLFKWVGPIFEAQYFILEKRHSKTLDPQSSYEKDSQVKSPYEQSSQVKSSHELGAKRLDNQQIKSVAEPTISKSLVVIRHDITETLVERSPYKHFKRVSAKNMDQAIKMFANNRVDLIAISRTGIATAVQKGQIDAGAYTRIYKLKSVGDYYAFSKDTPDHIIHAFQKSLDNLKLYHDELKIKYGME